ncbi:16S rRNA (cytidine(1402)-2'-O)-methyltransferase [Vagococcus silagei]|uniref:Ribosomal RNA small subunit methyltransferase I n=1 Tax=Vagococcus silagei TaxID=2508885 RepID=A0A4S3B4P0_9ENTE|nr:16S rRNA (cytidine(1402)-2'-O)-methyltransferase [Vagococcus silagei]THB62031.1 16S rRNA (cytidine(1402)-2'-O)-methyltransferase [Vagococcus silagei]
MRKQKSFKGETNSFGKLYLVPTPIGNLEDMTFRSVKTLHDVALIASEDTRNTQKLLNHFEIKTKQISLHEHNVKERIPELITYLEEGTSIAQVSDAGMPSISDPGHELVLAAIEAEIAVVALPGASAGITALIASGITPQPFTFYGFLPRKKGEQLSELEKLAKHRETLIFYESPYRVAKTLETMLTHFEPTRLVTVCRELTKIHEEYLRGSLSEVLEYCQETPLKGECCLIVEGFSGEAVLEVAVDLNLSLKEQVILLMENEKLTSKEAIKKVAKRQGLKKQEVYLEYHEENVVSDN